jgi:hypothetical protein
MAPLSPKVDRDFEGFTLKGTKIIYEETYALRGNREVKHTITKGKNTKGGGIISNGHLEDLSN